MKKITAVAILFTLLFTFCSFGAKIDGEKIESTLLNGTTMAPLEDIARVMNLEFWPSSEQYAVSEKNDTPRMLNFVHSEPEKVYAQYYVKNADGSLKLTDEEELILPESAVRIDGKLFVPFRFVAEYFGANVYWSEEDGAWAYRTSYGKTALIRTDGKVRERVEISGNIESAVIVSDYLVVVREGELVRISLKDGSEKVIGKSGRVHVEGDKIFVLGSGKLTLIDVKTGESKPVDENITMVGYLAGGGAWCEKADKASVYDANGNHIADVTGNFENPWEYQDGFVYYLTSSMEMRRAKTDGSGEEVLIKTALYPEWVDGYIYYSDSLMNYRRFDVK
ncbi:MAG: stalk domain-containing protein, partial [Clostridia bacterium]|nr:stalk domain-containing protein [Clostridia bacterium]